MKTCFRQPVVTQDQINNFHDFSSLFYCLISCRLCSGLNCYYLDLLCKFCAHITVFNLDQIFQQLVASIWVKLSTPHSLSWSRWLSQYRVTPCKEMTQRDSCCLHWNLSTTDVFQSIWKYISGIKNDKKINFGYIIYTELGLFVLYCIAFMFLQSVWNTASNNQLQQ